MAGKDSLSGSPRLIRSFIVPFMSNAAPTASTFGATFGSPVDGAVSLNNFYIFSGKGGEIQAGAVGLRKIIFAIGGHDNAQSVYPGNNSFYLIGSGTTEISVIAWGQGAGITNS